MQSHAEPCTLPAMQSHAEPCRAMQNHIPSQPCRAMQCHVEPRRAMQSHTPSQPCRAMQSPAEPRSSSPHVPRKPPSARSPFPSPGPHCPPADADFLPGLSPFPSPSPRCVTTAAPTPRGSGPLLPFCCGPFLLSHPQHFCSGEGRSQRCSPLTPPPPSSSFGAFQHLFVWDHGGGKGGGWLKIHRVSPDPSCCVAMGLRAQCRAAPAASVGSAHWGWGDGGPMGVPPALNAWRCHHGEAGAAGGGNSPAMSPCHSRWSKWPS